MTREEWYLHTVEDHITEVQEYIDLISDDAVPSSLTAENIQKARQLLCVMSLDISRRLEELS